MDFKTYRKLQIAIVVSLAALVSSFVARGNFIIPIIAFAAAAGLVFVIKRNIKEITADERDIRIAGLAGRLTYSISAIIMALGAMVFFALGKQKPEYLFTGNVMAYLTCTMMILYIIFTWYYSNKKAI